MRLNVYKPMGLDGMHPRIVRELTVAGCSPSYLKSCGCQAKSLVTGKRETSIYKKGRKEAPGNYRPVSLISVSGKIM